MRRAAPPHVKLKAAGGVRTLDAMIEVAELGCDRIGRSRTAEILDELHVAARTLKIPEAVSLFPVTAPGIELLVQLRVRSGLSNRLNPPRCRRSGCRKGR